MFKKIMGYVVIIVLFGGSICGIVYGVKFTKVNNSIEYTQSTEVTTTIENYKNKIEEDRITLKNLYAQMKLITEANEALTLKNEELSKVIENLNIEKEAFNETINAKQEVIDGLNEQIVNLNLQIEALNNDQGVNQGEINKLNEKITALSAEKSTLIEDNLRLQSVIKTLNTTIDTLRDNVKTYEERVKTLNTQNANLQNNILSYEAEIENYKQIIEDLKKINSCVVSFRVDGELFNTQQVNKTEIPLTIDDPVSENYVFEGWMIEGMNEVVNPFTMSIVEDTTFVAKIRKNFNVGFEVDGVSISNQKIENRDDLVIPTIPIKEYYNFLGWSLDGESVIEILNYTFLNDTTFKAVFEMVPGLYNGGILNKSWSDLLFDNYLKLTEGILDYGVNRQGLQALQGNLMISSEVTIIKKACFMSCNFEEIVIPDSVEKVENTVFQNSLRLKSVNFMNNDKVDTIDYYTFSDCPNLKYIILPNLLTTVSEQAFLNSNNINYNLFQNALYLSSSESSYAVLVKGLKDENNSYLECKIHDDTKIVANEAFSHYGLTSVEFPEGLVSVGSFAFYSCDFVTLNLPSTLIFTGQSSFGNCLNLETVNFNVNSAMTVLGFRMFDGCRKLKNVNNLPLGLTHIDSKAFESTGFTNFTITSNIIDVYYDSFYGCSSLYNVVIESAEVYKTLTKFSYLIKNPKIVDVLISIVDNPLNTNTYLNDKMYYAKTVNGLYYRFTKK